MMLFHQTCRGQWRHPIMKYLLWRGRHKSRSPMAMARFLMIDESIELQTQTYRCTECGTIIHADMDWT
jgi:hypothetical protein